MQAGVMKNSNGMGWVLAVQNKLTILMVPYVIFFWIGLAKNMRPLLVYGISWSLYRSSQKPPAKGTNSL